DSAGVPEIGFVVLVGDLERLELVGIGVLAEPVVVEAQVHRFRGRGVEPHGEGGGVASGARDVELGGGELPEVAQARPDTAAGVAHVRIAAATGAPGSADPRMLGVGALG